MKRNALWGTNTFICAVIVLGFALTSLISYHSNRGIYKRDIEHISTLTSEGIYHQIDSIFTKPINISLTMANDSLLKDFLREEVDRAEDQTFVETMRKYLLAYKEKYSYDSVFLASARTNRYYHFDKGVDRMLEKDDPENVWYYTFLESPEEYSLNIDNDQVEGADNEITIFINCKIRDSDGMVMGVVGVGFRVNYLQQMFKVYEDEFAVKAYLVDDKGRIEISTEQTGYYAKDLFEDSGYEDLRDEILSGQEGSLSFWYSRGRHVGYLVTQYVPNLGWQLVIDNDTSAFEAQLNRQFYMGIVVIILVIGSVLFVVTSIIRKYNAQIVRLTIEKEKEHRSAFQAATEKLYENIYEIDITHNCAASEETEEYFESLGAPPDIPYDEALQVIAKKQIKAEYRQGYIDTFSTSNVLRAYENGEESLQYDFMITNDGGAAYYWMRITTRIFFWKDDQSVRMFAYRQNIDEEKKQEAQMLEKMQKDSLSGLYNKAATQEYVCRMLAKDPKTLHAFFIVDIDNFKTVNDTYGHATGDRVIVEFARALKEQFRTDDVVGRIGGDEFAAFVDVPYKGWAENKAASLTEALRREVSYNGKKCRISASIGVAVSPEAGNSFEALYRNADSALYSTKRNGKNGYTIYHNL